LIFLILGTIFNKHIKKRSVKMKENYEITADKIQDKWIKANVETILEHNPDAKVEQIMGPGTVYVTVSPTKCFFFDNRDGQKHKDCFNPQTEAFQEIEEENIYSDLSARPELNNYINSDGGVYEIERPIATVDLPNGSKMQVIFQTFDEENFMEFIIDDVMTLIPADALEYMLETGFGSDCEEEA
jgi:hypothetical protein